MLIVLALYAASSLLGFLQGYLLNDVVQATVFGMRAEIEDKICADAAAELPTNRRLTAPRNAASPVADLVDRIVEKHNSQVSPNWMHTHMNQVRK